MGTRGSRGFEERETAPHVVMLNLKDCLTAGAFVAAKRAFLGFLIGALVLSESVRAGETSPPANATLVYVGTYTGTKSKGIHLFWLRTENNEVSQNITLVPLGLAAETPSPSFLEIDPKRRLLFAVNEIDQFEGKPTGAVSAFAIDPVTGKLKLLNQRSSMG